MTDETSDGSARVARATQRALVDVALRAYEEAGLSGLCAEGRWEVAIGAMRDYDVAKITSKRDRADVP
jgi:hypothetical protein